MSYSDKLRDPRWQKKRLIILERDKWQCRICEDQTSTLHVHHIFYDNAYPNPWDYPDHCLLSLCANCHESEHQDYKTALLFLQHQMAKSGIQIAAQIDYLESIIRETFINGVYRG
jgi:hypothetical protein